MLSHKDLPLLLMRGRLIECLAALASREHTFSSQPEFWGAIQVALGVFDEADMYDSPPKNQIGYVFCNYEEAKAVSQVIEATNRVYDLQPDSEGKYLVWGEVIRAANYAYQVMLTNEPDIEDEGADLRSGFGWCRNYDKTAA